MKKIIARSICVFGAAGILSGCMTTTPSMPTDPRLGSLVASPPDYSRYAERRIADADLAATQGKSLAGSYYLLEASANSSLERDAALETGLGEFYGQLIPEELEGLPDSKFYVTNEINTLDARAIKTGDILLTHGAIRQTRHWDDLAYILSHEGAHVASDHFKDRENRDNANTAIGVMLMATILIDGLANDGQATNKSNLAMGAALGAMFINEASGAAWSRRQEIEADQLALDMLYHADYSRDGAINVLEKLVDAEARLREAQEAAMVDRCGERQTVGDQIAKGFFQGLVGDAALTAADRDPICAQWNSIAARLFEPKKTDKEIRLEELISYDETVYGSVTSRSKQKSEFLDSSGRPVADFARLKSPDGPFVRTSKAADALELLDAGQADAAWAMAKSALRTPQDGTASVRHALYIIETEMGRPDAYKHLEYAVEAGTQNSEILLSLLSAYKSQGRYDDALLTLERVVQRTRYEAEPFLPQKVELLRLAGRADELTETLEICGKAKNKSLRKQCEINAVPPVEEAEGEQIISAVSFRVFNTALGGTEISSLLEEGGNYTIFMATDAALVEHTGKSVDQLLAWENRGELRKLVASHIIRRDGDAAFEKINNGFKDRLTAQNTGFIGDSIILKDAEIYGVDTVINRELLLQP